MTGHFSRLAGALLFWFAGISAAATPLFLPASAPGLRAKSTADGVPVRFNAEGIAQLAPGAEVEMTLPDGSIHTYLHESFVQHGGGITTWIARSPITGDTERAIITYGPHGAWGWMATTYGHFRVFPSGAGHDLVAPQPKQSFAPKFEGGDAIPAGDDPPEIAPLKGIPTVVMPMMKSTNPFAKVTPSPVLQSDVMFIYTRDLAEKLGIGLIPMLHNMIATLNQTYTDSEVAITLRLVRAYMMDYPNTNGSSETLNGMRGFGTFAPLFDGITYGAGSVRDQVGADFVALLRDGPSDTGGIASLLSNQSVYPSIVTTQTAAMSVNNFCASGCQGIVAHELGHNMGNHHDRATIAKDVNGVSPLPQGVFPYSYGHYSCSGGLTCNPFAAGGCPSGYADCAGSDVNDFGTIMSYFGPKVMKYSNPNVQCMPAGGNASRACGGNSALPAPAGSSDNALSMNNVRGNIAAYRTQMFANQPASIQFTNAAFTGTETGGILTFTLSRIGGANGAVAVNYSFSSGTATAGTDFTATNGTVQWADGDTSNKTINVTITNDGVAEGNETFTATLSNPTGAPGTHLGYPIIATGIIVEPWPIGGTAPTGFTNPSGPAWAVATDSAYETGNSWKSGAIAFQCPPTCAGPPPVPPASVTQYVGDFSTGNVAFAYRVNSYPNQGFFEFLVDGTVVASNSGDSGWQFISVPIAAGSHTLQWRYRPTLYFPCATANPPPPQGASCADRAWIDSVSLPLAPPASVTTITSSANPLPVGQTVTFTVSVSGGFGAPTGTITFLDGAAQIPGCVSVALASGSAACSTNSLTVGMHSISATYSGSPQYAASFSSPLAQVIASGSQLLTANPPLLSFGGQSMNTTSPALVATVSNPSSGAVTVTNVTVTPGYSVSHNCNTVVSTGLCQVSVSFTPQGVGAVSGSITIEYAGGGPTIIGLEGTGERSLVTHYYRSILRRAPDAGGKTFWDNEATRVNGLGANAIETWFAMAQSFYFSPEYLAFNRSNSDFLTDLYNTFFNRAPDPDGLSYWTGQLASGLPREVALAGFMFSAEFSSFAAAIFGTPVTRAEVNALTDFYRGLLARLPDNNGFNYWLTRFRAAQCAGPAAVVAEVESISSGYALSPEYAARARSNAQYVGDLYNAFLRRGGDLAGVNFWIGQIANNLRTREQVRVEFKNSTEFQARVQAIINQGCLP